MPQKSPKGKNVVVEITAVTYHTLCTDDRFQSASDIRY